MPRQCHTTRYCCLRAHMPTHTPAHIHALSPTLSHAQQQQQQQQQQQSSGTSTAKAGDANITELHYLHVSTARGRLGGDGRGLDRGAPAVRHGGRQTPGPEARRKGRMHARALPQRWHAAGRPCLRLRQRRRAPAGQFVRDQTGAVSTAGPRAAGARPRPRECGCATHARVGNPHFRARPSHLVHPMLGCARSCCAAHSARRCVQPRSACARAHAHARRMPRPRAGAHTAGKAAPRTATARRTLLCIAQPSTVTTQAAPDMDQRGP